jgi:hypothetical protein
MDTVAPEITGKKVAPSAKARGKVPQSRGTPKKRRQGRLTLTIPECAQLLGIGRNAAYRAAENGELGQILRVGKPSTPETIRDDVFRRAGTGETLSVAAIRQAIDQARGKTPTHKPSGRLRELCERMSAARPDDPLVKELHALLFGAAAADPAGR